MSGSISSPAWLVPGANGSGGAGGEGGGPAAGGGSCSSAAGQAPPAGSSFGWEGSPSGSGMALGRRKPSSPSPRPGSTVSPAASWRTNSGASPVESGPTKRPSTDAIGAMSHAPRHSNSRRSTSSSPWSRASSAIASYTRRAWRTWQATLVHTYT